MNARSRRTARFLLTLLFGVGLLGCGADLRALGTIMVPAVAPVRTAPAVFFGLTGHPLSDHLTRRIVGSLNRDGTHAEAVHHLELRRRGQQGVLPPGSLVVMLNMGIERLVSNHADGSGHVMTVVVFRGGGVLRVLDAPTGRLLQTVSSAAESSDYRRTATALEHQVWDAFTMHREGVFARLVPVALEGVEPALEHLTLGHWRVGREALERLRNAANGLEPEARAAFLYDLGVAQRFDETQFRLDPEGHFDRAQQTLELAVSLDPQPLYQVMLAGLITQRRGDAVAREQYAAERRIQAPETVGWTF